LEKPVSSTIQASIGPLLSIDGRTNSQTFANTASSDHRD